MSYPMLSPRNGFDVEDFIPPMRTNTTKRMERRLRIAFNRGVREWRLAIGREARREERLNPWSDDDFPF